MGFSQENTILLQHAGIMFRLDRRFTLYCHHVLLTIWIGPVEIACLCVFSFDLDFSEFRNDG